MLGQETEIEQQLTSAMANVQAFKFPIYFPENSGSSPPSAPLRKKYAVIVSFPGFRFPLALEGSGRVPVHNSAPLWCKREHQ